MNRKLFLIGLLFLTVFAWTICGPIASAAEPIVIGVPTSLGFLEGKESHKAVQMAVGEINANGGVMVGGEKRPFKVVAADLRDAAAGVPVPEALLGLEKLILEQKPTAIRGRTIPLRSSAGRHGYICQIQNAHAGHRGDVPGHRSQNQKRT